MLVGQRRGGFHGHSAESMFPFMNAKLLLLCFVSAWSASAADPSVELNSTVHRSIPLTESERMQNFITARRDAPVITLGKSDFVLSGPLVEGLRRLPHEENLSRGKRFLRLPIIRLFVPRPIEIPQGGKYFAWRSDECSQPWPAAASRLQADPTSPANMKNSISIISVH
jgi:hypothetical protein